MSQSADGNTGVVPPPINGENEFENINSNESALNAPETAVNENATESFATSEPVDTTTDAAADASVEAESAVPVTANSGSVFKSKTGRTISEKQYKKIQEDDRTAVDMEAQYKERFSSYSKPPKVKRTDVARLAKIRREDGENAYSQALKNVMDLDDPNLGKNGKSRRSMSLKAKKQSVNVTRNNSKNMGLTSGLNAGLNAGLNSALNAMNNSRMGLNATNTVLNSIDEMARTAKGLIDTIAQTSRTLAKGINKESASSIKPLTNVSRNTSLKPKRVRSKTTKKAPLFTVPEETSLNLATTESAL
jgi:hypothetical protein